ncbi:hypothetical protein D1872_352910 [compost metagenome]
MDHADDIVGRIRSERAAAQCNAVGWTIMQIQIFANVVLGRNDFRQAEDRPWRIVRVDGHFDA